MKFNSNEGLGELVAAIRELQQSVEGLTDSIRFKEGGIRNLPIARTAAKLNVAPAADMMWAPETAQKFLGCLGGKQRELVDYLLIKGTATVGELMEHLQLPRGRDLAGVRASLTRSAQRETGSSRATVIEWRRASQVKDWRYKLNPQLEAFLCQHLNK